MPRGPGRTNATADSANRLVRAWVQRTGPPHLTGSPGPAVSHRGPRSNVWHARTPPPRRGSRERAPEWSSGPGPASWQPQTPAHCLAHRTPPRPGAAGGPPQWSSGPGPASWQPRTPTHRVASSPCPEYPSSPDQVLVPRTGYCLFRKMGALSFPIFPVSLSRPPSRARPGRTTNGDGATSLGQAPSYKSSPLPFALRARSVYLL